MIHAFEIAGAVFIIFGAGYALGVWSEPGLSRAIGIIQTAEKQAKATLATITEHKAS